MMAIINYLIIGTFIAYIVYILFEDNENDIIQKRLMKYAHDKQEEKDEEKKVSIRQALSDLLEPIITSTIRKRINTKSIKQLLLEAGLASSEEEAFKFKFQKYFLGALGVCFGLFII